MSDFDYEFSSITCPNNFESESPYNAHNLLFALSNFVIASCVSVMVALYNNQIDYDSRQARIIAGFLRLFMLAWHTDGKDIEFLEPKKKVPLMIKGAEVPADEINVKQSEEKSQVTPSLQITDNEGSIKSLSEAALQQVDSEASIVANSDGKVSLKSLGEVALQQTTEDKATSEPVTKGRLIAIVPHRAGILEGVGVASKLKGRPLRFFATDMFDFIPGVAATMKMFKTIPIAANPNGKSGNSGAIDLGVEALNNGESIAVFPQGGFSRIDEEPLRIYSGVAKMAIKAKVAIDVLRLDGLWSLSNRFIPVSIRNNTYYRALFSAFHLNKITTRACALVDYHLQEENQDLSEEALIEEICAQLYAYGRHTHELSDEQLKTIDVEISEGRHLPIWRTKVELCDRRKALEKVIKAEPERRDTLKIEQEMVDQLKIKQDEREEVIFASPTRLCL